MKNTILLLTLISAPLVASDVAPEPKAIFAAIDEGNIELIKGFLEGGLDPNAGLLSTRFGNQTITPVQYTGSCIDCCRILDNGNDSDTEEKTAPHREALPKLKAIADLLIRHGGNEEDLSFVDRTIISVMTRK